MAAGGGEVRLALADRVQVDAVQPRLQPRDGQRDFDDLARALLTLDERRPTGDSLALDVRVRLYGAACGRGLGGRLRRRLGERDRSHRTEHGGYH